MTWSKARPTQAWFYWVKHPTLTHPLRLDFAEVSCTIRDSVKSWYVTARGYRTPIHEYDGSWWYPIEMPDFPPDDE